MSISLSVSEVETAVLEGLQLEAMIDRTDVAETGGNPCNVDVKDKEGKKQLRQFRKGKGVEASSRPSTRRSAAQAEKKEIKVLKRGEKTLLRLTS